jgi:hypothetical protein
MILLSLVYTLTKSPFPIPNEFANDFGRTIENDDSPTSPCTFLNSLLLSDLCACKAIDYIGYKRYKKPHEQYPLNPAHGYLYIRLNER